MTWVLLINQKQRIISQIPNTLIKIKSKLHCNTFSSFIHENTYCIIMPLLTASGKKGHEVKMLRSCIARKVWFSTNYIYKCMSILTLLQLNLKTSFSKFCLCMLHSICFILKIPEIFRFISQLCHLMTV